MKFVVSGLTGGVGSYLRVLLEKEGHEIVAFQQDSSVPGDRFLHLAAYSGNDYKRLVDSNIQLIYEVIEYCLRSGIRELIFFSAASIYGNLDGEEITEDAPSLGANAYSVSKLMGESIFREAAKSGELRSLCLRLPAVLTNKAQHNLLSRWYKALKRNEGITLYNAEKPFRNFVTVQDLARFLPTLSLEEDFDVINTASEAELTLRELVEMMRDELGSSSKIESSSTKMPFLGLSSAKARSKYGLNTTDTASSIKNWLKLLESPQ